LLRPGNYTVAGLTNNGIAINNGTLNDDLDNTSSFTNNMTMNAIVNSNTGTITNNGTWTGQVTSNVSVISNAGSWSGNIVANAGTISNQTAASWSGSATNTSGTLNNDGTWTGTISNSGTFDNTANGTLSGLLTQAAGTTTNTGQLNGGVNVTGGSFTQNGGTVSGGLSNTATVNANGGAINGAITNNGQFNVGGTVTGDNTFTNAAGASLVLAAASQYSATGLVTNNGSVSVASAATLIANAGFNNQASLISAGTLSGGLVNTGTVIASGGAINGAIANNAGSFTATGVLTGDGTFNNEAAATLAVTNTGSYTLQGLLTNSGMVTVAGGGRLIATAGGITNLAGGSIMVAAGGTAKDDLNNAGAVSNSGAYFANVATNTGAGSITNTATGTWTGNVASNAALITNNGAWIGNINNSSDFINTGALTGSLTNSGGIATNAGTISGTVTITGGALTGTGAIGALNVGAGGIFAPGNGTAGASTAINGSLVLQSGAQYLVMVNPATASFASVTGKATLGGATVNAVFANGSYISKQYTILTAAGGVGGSFGALSNVNLPANFSDSLSTDATHAYLNLTINFAIPGGLNGNQQAVGNALTHYFNSEGGIPLVYGKLTAAQLTQASGEIATGSQQATFDAMNLFMGVLTDPFAAGRDTAAMPAASPYADQIAANAYAAIARPRDGPAPFTKAQVAPAYEPHWSVWGAGFGGTQTTSDNPVVGSNSATSAVYGSAAGADYHFSPNTIAGFALAGGGTSFSVANGGTGRSDLFQAGAFIRHTADAAYVSAALAYGWQDITTNRTMSAAGFDQLQARFDANAISGRLEGGYRYLTPWMGVTPYAAAQFTTLMLPVHGEQAISRHLRAELRRQPGHRSDQRTGHAHRQILCARQRDPDAAQPLRLGARLRSRSL